MVTLLVLVSIVNGAPNARYQEAPDMASCIQIAETYNQLTAEDSSTFAACIQFKAVDA